ncbi:MAG: helix-turn-helix domain-containing protein [Synoicihabitans sp.]
MGTARSKMPTTSEKKISRAEPPQQAAVVLETIMGCKWSLTVYQLMEAGVNRPGAMERSVEGLSAKVLNDCLRRNLELGILEKISFPEIPPRVEYVFTDRGRELQKVLAAVAAFQRGLDASETSSNA